MKNRYKRGQLPVLYICLVSRFWTRLCRYIGSHPSPHQCLSPGYPLLMTPLRFFTDSIIAQKILNGLFLLGGALLLFFFMIKRKMPESLALVGACAAILSDRVLHFSTMMMSEMSCFFVSTAAIFLLANMKKEKPFYKDLSFYGMLVMVILCYHIRTQGVALFAAVVLFFSLHEKVERSGKHSRRIHHRLSPVDMEK